MLSPKPRCLYVATMGSPQRTKSPLPALQSGDLATVAISRMESELSWYSHLSADDRSWVNLVAQKGIANFVEWLEDPRKKKKVSPDVFGSAPQALTRSINLEQTVELVRLTISVVEEFAATLENARDIQVGVLEYSREIAFATALVYARAAEARGGWDARLEALVVDGVLRGEVDASLLSRANALGWQGKTPVSVIVGNRPEDDIRRATEAMRRYAKHAQLDVMAGVVGQRLVAIVGGTHDPMGAARHFANVYAPGPVIAGHIVDSLDQCHFSAQAALSGFDSANAWPGAPRPVSSNDLLPERALGGDDAARELLISKIFKPLVETGGELIETIDALVTYGGIEPASRALFVHANTVRYRMRKITEVSDYSPMEPRELFVLNIALSIGRLGERH